MDIERVHRWGRDDSVIVFLGFLKSYFPFVINCISHDLKGHFSDLAGCLGLVGQSKDSMEIERVGGGGIMQQSG